MTYALGEKRLLSGVLTSDKSLVGLELGLLLLKVSNGVEKHRKVLLEECVGRKIERSERGLNGGRLLHLPDEGSKETSVDNLDRNLLINLIERQTNLSDLLAGEGVSSLQLHELLRETERT